MVVIIACIILVVASVTTYSLAIAAGMVDPDHDE